MGGWEARVARAASWPAFRAERVEVYRSPAGTGSRGVQPRGDFFGQADVGVSDGVSGLEQDGGLAVARVAGNGLAARNDGVKEGDLLG